MHFSEHTLKLSALMQSAFWKGFLVVTHISQHAKYGMIHDTLKHCCTRRQDTPTVYVFQNHLRHYKVKIQKFCPRCHENIDIRSPHTSPPACCISWSDPFSTKVGKGLAIWNLKKVWKVWFFCKNVAWLGCISSGVVNTDEKFYHSISNQVD